MSKQEIHTKSAPQAIGPYSQAIAVIAKEMVFCSGQIGLDPETGKLVEGLEAQTRRVMDNLKAVLAAGGVTFGEVVKTTIYLTDLRDFEKVNEIYGSVFEGPAPARATVEVAALPKGARVEIDAIAVKA